MLEGAAILLAGMVIGYWLDRRMINRLLRSTGKLPAKPRPIRCSCGHAPSFHDPETKRCHYKWMEEVNYADVWVQCDCRRYDGPEPLPEFYAPEIQP